MEVLPGDSERGPIISSAVLSAVLALLALTIATGIGVRVAVPLVAIVAIVVVAYRRLLTWRNLVATLIGVILFIPIGRLTLPGGLPFQLEPYRIFVALLCVGWLGSLLVDSRVRLRMSGLEGPLFLFAFAALGSVIVNSSRVDALGVQAIVAKKLTFFASFLLVFFLIASVVVQRRDADFLVRVLVAGGAAVAGLSLIEFSTGYNVFNHIASIVPLHQEPLPRSLGSRGERLRVFASAQHPIALGAALVMLIPLAAYLWQTTRSRLWAAAAGLLLLGTIATESRTAIVMAAVIVFMFVRLRPRETKRLWPALLPALLVIHFALPGSVGSLKDAFFPKGGLIAQQQSGKGTYGSGRIADLGPGLAEWGRRPVLGEGSGTRVTDKGPQQNALILDDQWLSTLLETGAVGALALLWLFVRIVKRLKRVAREDTGPTGWLCAALAASVTAFAVGMATYDAFSFIQVTFILFILLGLGSSVLARVERDRATAQRRKS